MKIGKIVVTIAVGGMLSSLLIPNALAATSDPSMYSDRDRAKSSKDETEKLEQALKTGEGKDFYRRQLEKMGWKLLR
jgi:hypothetical protein